MAFICENCNNIIKGFKDLTGDEGVEHGVGAQLCPHCDHNYSGSERLEWS